MKERGLCTTTGSKENGTKVLVHTFATFHVNTPDLFQVGIFLRLLLLSGFVGRGFHRADHCRQVLTRVNNNQDVSPN